MDNTLEIIAIIVSLISLVVSCALALWEIWKNKKINDVNLEADLFKDVLKLYLTKLFPDAVSQLHFENDVLVGIENLQNTLIDFKNELKFFRYRDVSFFNNLQDKLQAVENYILEKVDEMYTYEEQDKIIIDVSLGMTDVYNLVGKKYKNG